MPRRYDMSASASATCCFYAIDTLMLAAAAIDILLYVLLLIPFFCYAFADSRHALLLLPMLRDMLHSALYMSLHT